MAEINVNMEKDDKARFMRAYADHWTWKILIHVWGIVKKNLLDMSNLQGLLPIG